VLIAIGRLACAISQAFISTFVILPLLECAVNDRVLDISARR